MTTWQSLGQDLAKDVTAQSILAELNGKFEAGQIVDAQDSGEREYTHVVATVTNSGTTTVYTPAAGKSIKLRWLFITPSLESDPFPLIGVKIGSTDLYRFYGAMAKRQVKTGAVNAALTVNLSVSGSVAVTAILEEV